jgi:hypothetical protein
MSQPVRKLRHRNLAKNFRKPASLQVPSSREENLLATGMLDILLQNNKIRAERPPRKDVPGPKQIKKSTAKSIDEVNMVTYNVATLGKNDSVLLEILLSAGEENIDVIGLQGCRNLGAGGPGIVSGPFKMGSGKEYWVFKVGCTVPTGSKVGDDGLLLAFSADRWSKKDFVSQAVTVPGRAMSVRVRWSKHDITVHNFYAPVEQSSQTVKDKFWQALYRAKWRTLHRTTNIVLADANGHIGKDYNPPGIGTQGAEKYNVNGHFFADLVVACELAVINTYCSGKQAGATQHKGHRIDYACLPRKLLGYINHSKSGVSSTSKIGINQNDHYPVFLCWKKLPLVQDTLDKKKPKKTHGWGNINTNKLTLELREFEANRTRARPLPLQHNRIREMQEAFHDLRTKEQEEEFHVPTGSAGWWTQVYEDAGAAAAQCYEKLKEEIRHPWIDEELLGLIKARRAARFRNRRLVFPPYVLCKPGLVPGSMPPRTFHCSHTVPGVRAGFDNHGYKHTIFHAFRSATLESGLKSAVSVRTYWSKTEYYDQVAKSMASAAEGNNSKKMYEGLRKLGGKKKKGGPQKQSLQRSPGVPELDPLKELHIFEQHCSKVMGATREAVPNPNVTRCKVTGEIKFTCKGPTEGETLVTRLDSPHLVRPDEVRGAIMGGRLERATKKGDIPLEVWRALGFEAAEVLAGGLNELHIHGHPEDWTKVPIAWILKNGCPGHFPSEYRPIGILDQVLKVNDRIIAGKLNAQLRKLLHAGEYGYSKGRCREQAMLHLELVLELCRQEGLSLAVLQTDISKAFDSVDRQEIYMAILELCHCNELLHAVILRHETVLYVLSNGGEKLEIHVPNGLVQGDSLGPILWLLHYHRILTAELAIRGSKTLQGKVDLGTGNGVLTTETVFLGDIVFADDHHILIPFKTNQRAPLAAVIEMATIHFEVLKKHKATAAVSKSGIWWSLTGRGTKSVRKAVDKGLQIPGWGKLPTLPHLKILGGLFKGKSAVTEINARLADTRQTHIRLQKLWYSPSCLEATKVSITNSISTSVLLSGLSCRKVTRVHQRKLESMHTRALRRLSQ